MKPIQIENKKLFRGILTINTVLFFWYLFLLSVFKFFLSHYEFLSSFKINIHFHTYICVVFFLKEDPYVVQASPWSSQPHLKTSLGLDLNEEVGGASEAWEGSMVGVLGVEVRSGQEELVLVCAARNSCCPLLQHWNPHPCSPHFGLKAKWFPVFSLFISSLLSWWWEPPTQ